MNGTTTRSVMKVDLGDVAIQESSSDLLTVTDFQIFIAKEIEAEHFIISLS